MMKLISLILISTILQYGASDVSPDAEDIAVIPRAIEDEVREQLEGLRTAVTSRIYVAIDDINGATSTARILSSNLRKGAELTMSQYYIKGSMDISTWKAIAEEDNVDISRCEAIFDNVFNPLYRATVDSFPECIDPYTKDIEVLRDNSVYKIDTTITQVRVFEFQVERCAGNVACLAPLVREIELAHVDIPQTIGIEVLNLQSEYDVSKVTVQQCMWGKTGRFGEEATTILDSIAECINDSWP